MATASYWWTAYGWADKGSKLQTQLYVNRQPEVLTEQVLKALPSLRVREPVLEWVVPLEKPPPGQTPFAEPRDAAMLAKLGLSSLKAELSKFWPAGGAVWDALAICHFPDNSTGALLAEGKNYPREMYSTGTGAGKTGSPASIASRHQIERAVAWVQGRLQMPLDVSRWLDPLYPEQPSSSLFQTANRIAHAVWLQSQSVDAWVCHLLYLNDPLHHPTSCPVWKKGLARADRELGIEGLELPFAGHAWLDALDPQTQLADLIPGISRA